MTTATPPAALTATPSTPRRPRSWLWATGSILAVALVIVATLAGRAVISHARQAAQVVPAQTIQMQTQTSSAKVVPPLPVTTVIRPGAGVALFGVDAHEGHLMALTYAHEANCPPVGACPSEPALASFVTYDILTGKLLSTVPLTGALAASAQASVLLVDSGVGYAYAISAHHVDRFGTLTGQGLGGYDLPTDASGDRITGAEVASPLSLYLLSGGTLLALNADTGKELAHLTFAGSGALSGPVLDQMNERIYVLQTVAGQAPTLFVCDATTLRIIGRYTLPAATLLGPISQGAYQLRYLYTFGADGAVGRIATARLTTNNGAAIALTPDPQPALTGARALGWYYPYTTHLFAMNATTITAFAIGPSGALTPLAALPSAAPWPPAQQLPVYATQDIAALPADNGAVLLVRPPETASTSYAAPNAATAVILARAALAKLLSDTNQDPPFVTPQTFPLDLTPGSRATNYWIHFSDLGWRGPYPGHARTAATPTTGTPGAYTVTFSIDWDQLFVRQHTWTCEVQPDGAVRLVSESGDGVP
ncbi:MAG: hypothetical protein ABI068_06850 [Ktedonobacterales bacterium]